MHVRTAAALAIAATLSALPSPAPAARPAVMAQFDYLQGSYICKSSDHHTVTESWTHPLGGVALRATDVEKGMPDSEHTLAFDKASKRFYLLDIDADGGAGISNANAALKQMKTLNSADDATTEMIKLSPTSYKIHVFGTSSKGKKFDWSQTCSK